MFKLRLIFLGIHHVSPRFPMFLKGVLPMFRDAGGALSLQWDGFRSGRRRPGHGRVASLHAPPGLLATKKGGGKRGRLGWVKVSPWNHRRVTKKMGSLQDWMIEWWHMNDIYLLYKMFIDQHVPSQRHRLRVTLPPSTWTDTSEKLWRTLSLLSLGENKAVIMGDTVMGIQLRYNVIKCN